MTLNQERPPTIFDELRTALARHREWPTTQTAAQVIVTADQFVRAVDNRAGVIEQMRREVTPTDEALSQILRTETP